MTIRILTLKGKLNGKILLLRFFFCRVNITLKQKISHWSKQYIFEKYKSDVHRFPTDVHQFLLRENVPVIAANL